MKITSVRTKRTYFGTAAFVMGVLTVISLGANFTASQLNISAELFNQLNYITALSYCIFTPLTILLGIMGHILKNDSKIRSQIGIFLAIVPFLIKFAQLILAMKK
ncbi:MAG: hypothetical protein HZB50_07700 [Chloroflexi bacterium]|nr:hypothetical protein [Chloroflexota bacterium]